MAELTRRRIRNALLLGLGLIAGSAAIRDQTPTPHIRHVSTKMAHVEENPDSYDILFVGSSRVFRQISPKIFDDQLRSHSIHLRSFNFGIPAAKSGEVWHLLKRLENLGTIRPRYVFVEPDGLLIQINKENATTEREIYWHGPRETVMAIRSLQDLALGPRIRMSALHTSAFLFDRFSVGRLRLLGSQSRHSDGYRNQNVEDLGPDGDGFVPYVKAPGQTEFVRRQDFLDHLPRYHRMVARQARNKPEGDSLTAYHAAMLTRLKTAIEALGAEPVFILSPVTRPRWEVHHAHSEGLLPNLFAFDDASGSPGLYLVRNRFDFEHLNTDGSTIYSRLLADRFALFFNESDGGGEE